MIANINDAMRSTYKDAIACYGKDSQIRMAIEEMSELTKELCKHFRGQTTVDDIASEIADVIIMLEQLVMLFDCEFDVRYHIVLKSDRLFNRLAVFHGG